MNQEELNTILEQHKLWLDYKGGTKADLQEADLRGVDLQEADLRYADLRGADLRGADIDFSCWPLWCGSLNVKVDKRIAVQLAYHFCALDCDDEEYQAARELLLPLANQMHRIDAPRLVSAKQGENICTS